MDERSLAEPEPRSRAQLGQCLWTWIVRAVTETSRDASQTPPTSTRRTRTPAKLMPRQILKHVREPLPAWLARYKTGMIDAPTDGATVIDSFLRSRIACYPGSGVVDGELFETFTAVHAVHGVLHIDLECPASLVSEIVNRRFRPYVHVAGYRPLEVRVWDASTTQSMLGLTLDHPFDQAPKLQGACWAVLERDPDRSEAHGPCRLAFLHVQCEAVWLFWNLWVRGRRPPPFAMLLQDHGWGGNWTCFGRNGALHQLALASGQLPQWLLSVRELAWPGYRRLTDPPPVRLVPLPANLNQGECASVGGRALYAKDDLEDLDDDPTALEIIDRIYGTAAPDAPDAPSALPVPEVTSLASPYFPRRLYFAYGSNLNPAQFHRRCPGSEVIGPATLKDHRWYITDRGVASVRPDPGNRVHGVLARLTEEDERQLDRHEGVSLGLYQRQFVPVDVANGRKVTALIYTSCDIGVGSPRPGYLEGILSGALHHGLPAEAIANLAFAGGVSPPPPDDREPLFVYGTLMRGHSNHGHLTDGLYIGEAVTVDCFALYFDALPMAFEHDPVSPIHGELYSVSLATLAMLDRLEGHPAVYRRSRVPVRVNGGSTTDAWLYFHLDPSGRIDRGGRWHRCRTDKG